jgi:hypothetical protein
MSATPKFRTVIVKKDHEDDAWEAKAQMQFTGYTTKTFAHNETTLFAAGLAKTLGLPTRANQTDSTPFDYVSVSHVIDCNFEQRKILGGAKDCINIIFAISCAQESLLDELIAMIEDSQFDKLFEKELKEEEHLHVSAYAVNGKVSMGVVVTTAAKITAALGALFVTVTISVGTYKYRQLVASEAASFDSDIEERQHLQGAIHDRL